MDGSQFVAFLIAWASITSAAYAMYRVELVGKRADLVLRDRREERA
jgi:hypothetical protein